MVTRGDALAAGPKSLAAAAAAAAAAVPQVPPGHEHDHDHLDAGDERLVDAVHGALGRVRANLVEGGAGAAGEAPRRGWRLAKPGDGPQRIGAAAAAAGGSSSSDSGGEAGASLEDGCVLQWGSPAAHAALGASGRNVLMVVDDAAVTNSTAPLPLPLACAVGAAVRRYPARHLYLFSNTLTCAGVLSLEGSLTATVRIVRYAPGDVLATSAPTLAAWWEGADAGARARGARVAVRAALAARYGGVLLEPHAVTLRPLEGAAAAVGLARAGALSAAAFLLPARHPTAATAADALAAALTGTHTPATGTPDALAAALTAAWVSAPAPRNAPVIALLPPSDLPPHLPRDTWAGFLRPGAAPDAATLNFLATARILPLAAADGTPLLHHVANIPPGSVLAAVLADACPGVVNQPPQQSKPLLHSQPQPPPQPADVSADASVTSLPLFADHIALVLAAAAPRLLPNTPATAAALALSSAAAVHAPCPPSASDATAAWATLGLAPASVLVASGAFVAAGAGSVNDSVAAAVAGGGGRKSRWRLVSADDTAAAGVEGAIVPARCGVVCSGYGAAGLVTIRLPPPPPPPQPTRGATTGCHAAAGSGVTVSLWINVLAPDVSLRRRELPRGDASVLAWQAALDGNVLDALIALAKRPASTSVGVPPATPSAVRSATLVLGVEDGVLTVRDGSGTWRLASGPSVADGRWHHVVITAAYFCDHERSGISIGGLLRARAGADTLDLHASLTVDGLLQAQYTGPLAAGAPLAWLALGTGTTSPATPALYFDNVAALPTAVPLPDLLVLRNVQAVEGAGDGRAYCSPTLPWILTPPPPQVSGDARRAATPDVAAHAARAARARRFRDVLQDSGASATRVLVLVTAGGDAPARALARQTWLSLPLPATTSMTHYFVVPAAGAEAAAIEAAAYQDLLFVPGPAGSAPSLQAALAAVARLPAYDFLLIVPASATLVRLPALLHDVPAYPRQRLWRGFRMAGVQPPRTVAAAPLQYPTGTLPPYAAGPLCVLSADVVADVARLPPAAAARDGVPPDVALAYWINAATAPGNGGSGGSGGSGGGGGGGGGGGDSGNSGDGGGSGGVTGSGGDGGGSEGGGRRRADGVVLVHDSRLQVAPSCSDSAMAFQTATPQAARTAYYNMAEGMPACSGLSRTPCCWCCACTGIDGGGGRLPRRGGAGGAGAGDEAGGPPGWWECDPVAGAAPVGSLHLSLAAGVSRADMAAAASSPATLLAFLRGGGAAVGAEWQPVRAGDGSRAWYGVGGGRAEGLGQGGSVGLTCGACGAAGGGIPASVCGATVALARRTASATAHITGAGVGGAGTACNASWITAYGVTHHLAGAVPPLSITATVAVLSAQLRAEEVLPPAVPTTTTGTGSGATRQALTIMAMVDTAGACVPPAGTPPEEVARREAGAPFEDDVLVAQPGGGFAASCALVVDAVYEDGTVAVWRSPLARNASWHTHYDAFPLSPHAPLAALYATLLVPRGWQARPVRIGALSALPLTVAPHQLTGAPATYAAPSRVRAQAAAAALASDPRFAATFRLAAGSAPSRDLRRVLQPHADAPSVLSALTTAAASMCALVLCTFLVWRTRRRFASLPCGLRCRGGGRGSGASRHAKDR